MAKAPSSAVNKSAAKKFATVGEYMQSLTGGAKTATAALRKLIKDAVPEAKEGISYNMPCFLLNDKAFIWYAGWKSHIAMYPLTAAMEQSIEGLSEYKGAKHTVQLSIDKPLPVKLIKQIVKYRLKELK